MHKNFHTYQTTKHTHNPNNQILQYSYSNSAKNWPISHISSITNFVQFIDPQKSVLSLLSNFVHFIHPYKNALPSRVAIVSISRSRHWELFCKPAFRQDMTKIFTIFLKKFELIFSKVYKYIKNEILHSYYSRVMVKRSILQLYRTASFLAQLLMTASDHLFNKCDQKIRQVKNKIITHQIPKEKLKQLSLWNCCLVF